MERRLAKFHVGRWYRPDGRCRRSRWDVVSAPLAKMPTVGRYLGQRSSVSDVPTFRRHVRGTQCYLGLLSTLYWTYLSFYSL